MGTLSLEVEKGLYLGIDFGTTNSVVSIYEYDNKTVHTLKIDGYTVFPTVIQFEMDDEGNIERIFGIEAKEAAVIYPESTVVSIKRQLESDEPISIQMEDKAFVFDSETIVAEILTYLKQKADEYIRDDLNIAGTFSGCVITVPANSTDKQKRKMKKAAQMAGFIEDQIHLRLEPAAAAIAYAAKASESKKVMIYDFGGGTFDACLLSVEVNDNEPEISILSTYGENYLGGNDIDQIMVDLIYDVFLKLTDQEIDLFDFEDTSIMSERDKKMAIIRMKQIATSTKEKLSTAQSAKVVLAPFVQIPEPININFEINRDMFYEHRRQYQLDDGDDLFEKMKGVNVRELIQRTIESVGKCLEGGKTTKEEVDEIFLVGGSSSIYEVRKRIEDYFNKAPYQSKISPALSISQGAAHYCNQIMLPSVQGPKMNEKTVHSLGIEISGRRFLEILPKGESIPENGLTIESPYTLQTNYDDLTSMAITVFEDLEPDHISSKFVYEESLKRLSGTTLRGIPSKSKGEEKIKVIFNISRDNILQVEAISMNDDGIRTTLTVDELYEK